MTPRKPLLLAVWIAVVLVPIALQAQEANGDSGEFTAFTGVAYGGIHTHVAVGGSAGTSLSRCASALLEASVIPMGSATFPPARSRSRVPIYSISISRSTFGFP
jgi:hypothetical protein